MAEVHVTVRTVSNVVSVQNPDNGNGSNSKVEGTTADSLAKKVLVNGSAVAAVKNPA